MPGATAPEMKVSSFMTNEHQQPMRFKWKSPQIPTKCQLNPKIIRKKYFYLAKDPDRSTAGISHTNTAVCRGGDNQWTAIQLTDF